MATTCHGIARCDPLTRRCARSPAIPRGVWALGLVSLCMDLSSELIHALLPLYMAVGLGASTLTIGIVEGIAEATALIVKVFSGVLSDYFRRRKPLVVLGYGLGGLHQARLPAGAHAGLDRHRALRRPRRQGHPRRAARRADRRSLAAGSARRELRAAPGAGHGRRRRRARCWRSARWRISRAISGRRSGSPWFPRFSPSRCWSSASTSRTGGRKRARPTGRSDCASPTRSGWDATTRSSSASRRS